MSRRSPHSRRNPPASSLAEIHLVFGPSGAGKSTVGRFAARRLNWLHLEIDRFVSFDQPVEDGIDHYHLRTLWDSFWNSFNPEPLTVELASRTHAVARDHCILTFPSGVVPSPEHVAVGDLFLHVLYGTAADCIGAFLNRERKLPRGLDENHWLHNNGAAYLQFSLPYLERCRIRAFSAAGRHRKSRQLVGEIRRAAAGA